MTTDQFIKKYDGVHIDEDGSYGAQCWDLAARYAREVVGCPSFPTGSGGAEGLYRLFQDPIPKYFTRVPKSSGKLPPRGSLIVYDKTFSAPWGHVALVLKATADKLDLLEQNGANPNGAAYITSRPWHKAISGWLVPKSKEEDNMATLDQIQVYYRFYLGKAASSAAQAKYVGKVTLEKLEGILKGSSTYAAKIKAAKAGKLDVKEHLPIEIRKVYKVQDTSAISKQLSTANTTINQLTQKVKELGSRPTEQELADLKRTAEEANARAVDAVAKLEQKQTEDTEAENSILKSLRALWRVISRQE